MSELADERPPSPGSWAARARDLAQTVTEVTRRVQDGEEAPAVVEPYLDQVQQFLAEVGQADADAVDPSCRDALSELAQAHSRLKEVCREALDELVADRQRLNQSRRALSGYASVEGERGPRYFDQEG